MTVKLHITVALNQLLASAEYECHMQSLLVEITRTSLPVGKRAYTLSVSILVPTESAEREPGAM